MRPFRLARIAAEAEGVRLRGLMSRMALRIVFGVGALVFVSAALVFCHLAAWFELRIAFNQGFLQTTGILALLDLVIAAGLAFLAVHSSPSRLEIESIAVRRKALEGITSALTISQLVVPMVRLVTNLLRRRGR